MAKVGKHLEDLDSWFADRPRWLQDATARITYNGRLTRGDLHELIALCKAEVGIVDLELRSLKPQPVPKGFFQERSPTGTFRLIEISQPRGINALAPRKALRLGEGPLTVVYGATGSGKSGYVRALKHASGSHSPGALLSDVFAADDKEASCRFVCSINRIATEFHWRSSNGPIEQMKAIQVYDSGCAMVYVDEENEVAFEPPALQLFTKLVEVCAAVSRNLDAEIQTNPSKLPMLPNEFIGTKAAQWYGGLTHHVRPEEVESRCEWTSELEAELTQLTQRLAEANPAQKARDVRRVKMQLKSLHDDLIGWQRQLSDRSCDTYIAARADARAKRQAAYIDANRVFSNAPLEGVGSDTWKLLWEQGRLYSEAHAYPGLPFPNIALNSRCVLCQQVLDSGAKERFTSFEAFVRGALETQAAEAESHVAELAGGFPEIATDEVALKMDSSGINNEPEREVIGEFCTALVTRLATLIADAQGDGPLPALPSPATLEFLIDRENMLEQEALILDGDAKNEDRPSLEAQLRELKAQRWLSQQRAAIDAEVLRLKRVEQLEQSKRLTNTQQLSLKKSNMTDELITSAYVERFQKGLNALGASRIRARLVKTRAERGHVFHKIRLDGCVRPVDPSEVLSEGEFRVVSLAAFLADGEGREDKGPFVFDDPITSMDQSFEEATARTLVELSQERQVIVFTHRLSLLELLKEEAERLGVKRDVVSLRAASWGIGDPDETFDHFTNPGAALNVLLQKISKAREAFQQSSGEYEAYAKGLCSHFRIVIERLVEKALLADVLTRFRRSVQTKNKIRGLAKISAADCDLIDDLMTRYSKYEHSQPLETPIPLPTPDELERDIRKTQVWLEEFNARPLK